MHRYADEEHETKSKSQGPVGQDEFPIQATKRSEDAPIEVAER
jgi:hypothetical protein